MAAAAPSSLGGAIGAEQNLVQQESKFADKTDAQMQGISKAETGLLSDFQDQLKALKAQAPAAPELKPFQAPQQQNPAQMFGSFAGILATLGSFETKTPLTTSLNAMAQGMKAIREGNADAYDKAFKEWQTNTDYALKVNELENSRYMQNIELAKTDYETAMANLQAQATMLHDQAAMFTLRSNGIEGLGDLVAKREQLGIEAMKYRTMVDRQGQAQQKKMNQVASIGDSVKQIDAAMAQLNSDVKNGISTTGVGGLFNRTKESIVNQAMALTGNPAEPQPARDFSTTMENVKNTVRLQVAKSRYMSPGAVAEIDNIVKGESGWDTPQDAQNSLKQIRQIMVDQGKDLAGQSIDSFIYDTPQDVKDAVDAGELDPNQGVSILQSKFGMK